jgi:uncharacterized protein YkwD
VLFVATASLMLWAIPSANPANAGPTSTKAVATTPPEAQSFSDNGAAALAFIDFTNGERGRKGMRPLVRNSELDQVARSWAVTIGNGKLRHADDLSIGLDTEWRKLGENLGRGPAPLPVHQALMLSTSHRANLLDPAFTQIGVAVINTDVGMLVVERFRQPQTNR